MKKLSVAQAKAEFSLLLNEVAFRGERVLILSHGKPKAVLISPEELECLEGGEMLAEWEQALQEARMLRQELAARGGSGLPAEEDLFALRKERSS